MYELIYTSVPRGLLLGRSGFCPVAWTQGMPANFIPLLDRMDSYIHQLPDQQWAQEEAAICYSCRHCKLGRKSLVLLSRIAAFGLDYQGKSNKIAHHFIFDDAQEYSALPDGGVSVCLAEENFLSRWEQSPGLLPPFSPRIRSLNSHFAQQWESITGDAGWAGVIAEFFLRDLSPGFYVSYPPGTPDHILLELVAEIVRLLPKSRLAEFTFSTLFVQTPVNWDCFLRFSMNESPLLLPLQQSNAKHFLSFTDPKPVPAEWEAWELVVQARKGLPTREQQLLSGVITGEDADSLQVAALPGEETGAASYVLKKSDETLANFVTSDGKNAAVEKSRQSRMKLFVGVFLIVSLVLGLGYYAFSLLSLEKALAEASGIALPALVSDLGEAPLLQKQVEEEAACPLSAEELWHWYLAWQDKSVWIPLPSGLAVAEGVSVELSGIGAVTDHLPFGWEQLAVRSSGQGTIVEVLPLRPAVEPNSETAFEVCEEAAPAQCLTLSIPELQLQFPTDESPGLKLPCHADVLKIEFLVGSARWCWTPDFRADFLSFLQRGQVTVQDWNAVYQPSGDEVRFGRYFEIRIGSLQVEALPNLSLADWIRQWNLLVPQYGDLNQKLSLLRLKSKEEIRRFYSHTQKREYNPLEWDLLSQKITEELLPASAAPVNELPLELTGLLEEAVLMLYDYAFSVFYQETGSRPEAGVRNDWKAKGQQLQVLFQNVREKFSRDAVQNKALLELQDAFDKLTQYSQRMQEYSQQAGELKQRFDQLKQQETMLHEKLSAFTEQTQCSKFFQQYLESKQEIPFQQSQYQAFAAVLNQNISYDYIVPENKP